MVSSQNRPVSYKGLLSGGSSKHVSCEENGGEPVNERVRGAGVGVGVVSSQKPPVSYKGLLSGTKSYGNICDGILGEKKNERVAAVFSEKVKSTRKMGYAT